MSEKYDLYSVESLEYILGNEHSIGRLRTFSSNINKGIRSAPLLVYGPSGVGKTKAIHLLAKENNWNIVELNASDYRDKETIEKRLISAATSRSLFGGKNLILLDEIDELAARFDKGSGVAIGSLIGKSKNPIIFTANDMWDQSISFLRNKVDTIEFKRIAPETINLILTNLAKRFSINVNKEVIEIISNRANGDARSAINDFYVIIGSENDADVTESIGLRDRKIDVFNTLDKIFLTNTISAPLRAAANTDLTNDMLIKWIDENIPKRYRQRGEIYDAFDSLSNATIFGTRASRSQYYTYWRYMNACMSSGVALSKKEYPNTTSAYSFPRVIKELSGSKIARNQEKIIAKKLQSRFHSSIKKIIRNEMGLISQIAAKALAENKDSKEEIKDYLISTYQLEEKEIEYLLSRNS